ncbi:21094_t:CDS:2 [Rhizophagus irregularis]|nr:21094_t:CDS:2 [Rhizophagus irregularis]
MDSDTNLYNAGPKTEGYNRKNFLISFKFKKVNSMFGLSKFDMDQLQDIMNIYQDLGITIMKEKINAWYPFKSQNSDKPFEMTSEILKSLYPLMSKVLNLNQENYAKLSKQILEEITKNKTYVVSPWNSMRFPRLNRDANHECGYVNKCGLNYVLNPTRKSLLFYFHQKIR